MERYSELPRMNYSVLDKDEQLELVKRAQNGDIGARNKLVLHNLKFVARIAWGYANRHGLQDRVNELFSSGCYGLIIAVYKYDFNERNENWGNFAFLSYAVSWIRQKILKEINDERRMVHVPAEHQLGVRQFKKAVSRESQRIGRGARFDEFLKEFGLDKYGLEFLLGDEFSTDRLTTSGAYFEIPDNKHEEDFVYSAEVKSALDDALNTLDERKKDIITSFYGLNGREHEDMRDIGKRLGISRERVRQLRNHALGRLRKNPMLREMFEGLES